MKDTSEGTENAPVDPERFNEVEKERLRLFKQYQRGALTQQEWKSKAKDLDREASRLRQKVLASTKAKMAAANALKQERKARKKRRPAVAINGVMPDSQ